MRVISVIKRKFKTLLHLIRHKLLLANMLYLLSKIGIKIKLFYWVRERFDENISVTLKDDLEKYSFEMLDAKDAKDILAARGSLNPEEIIQKELYSQSKCLVARCGEEIAAFAWMELSRCSSALYEMPLERNEAYLFDMHTFQKFRGKNLAPYLRAKCYKYLNDMGYDTFYSISEYFNTSSIKFKQKLGAEFLKLIISVTLFNKISWLWERKVKKAESCNPIYHFFRSIHRKIPVRYRRLYYDPACKMIYLYKTILKSLRPTLTIIEGTDASGRFPLSFAYAGERPYDFEYWTGLVLAPGFRKYVLGEKWIWQVKKIVHRLYDSCSLIVFELTSFTLKMFSKYKGLQSAHWVGMVIDISEPVESSWRKHRCKQRAEVLRRIRKNNLSYMTSNDPKLFDEFYYNMHIPFIKERHQAESLITGYDETKNFFSDGILLFIKQQENIIAGQIIVLNEDGPVLKILGVKDGKDEYLRLGVIGAMYYFPILEMQKRGYKILDVGRTRPFLTNGVTKYKIGLGARLLPEMSSSRGYMHIQLMKNTLGLKEFLIRNPFLYYKKDKHAYRALFVDDGQFDERKDFEKYFMSCNYDGLKGTSIFVFGSLDKIKSWVNLLNCENVSVEPAEAMFS
jgi:hypothetical protein